MKNTIARKLTLKMRLQVKVKLLVTFCFLMSNLYSQNQQIDSLTQILKTNNQDTNKLEAAVQLSEICEINDIALYANQAIELSNAILNQPNINKRRILILKAKALNNYGVMFDYQENVPKAIEYYNACLKLNEITQDIESTAATLNNIGGAYKKSGNTTLALNFYLRSLKMWEQTQNKTNTAISSHNLGQIFSEHGDVKKALFYYFKSLKLREEIGDKKALASSFNNIGHLLGTQQNYRKALYYLIKSLKYSQEINDKKETATTLNNIGSLYQNMGNQSLAFSYYNKSIQIREQINDKNGIASSSNNIGYVHLSKGDIQSALYYFQKSLAIHRAIGTTEGLAISFNSIGRLHYENACKLNGLVQKKELNLAYVYLDSSLYLSKKIGFPERIRNAERIISKVDSARGNYLGAYEHYKQYTIFRDSVSSERSRKTSIETQLNFEFEKKEAVLKEQQLKERSLAKEKSKFQLIIIEFIAAGLLIVIILAFVIFKNLRKTSKQKKLIEEQKHLVDEKQKEILDSIHYAKRIQQSLLPTEKFIERILNKK
ncbi:MAG: tetratricopeptide repeat protein [Sphingobacteriaceae bacterium]|nr:tetratricopeptide repeat protein [Sphingobacteriaceae bacterium]